MKQTITIALLMVVFSFVLSSCKSKEEKVIDQLNDLTEQIEKKSEKWDTEDWQKAFKKVEEIHNEMSECDFTDEQLKKLGEVEGRLTSVMIKRGLPTLEDGIGSFMKGVGSFINGFQDGVQEGAEESFEEIGNYVNDALDLLNEQGADE